MNKSIFSILSTLLLGLSVTACSQSGPGGSSAPQAANPGAEGAGRQFVASGNEPFWTVKASRSTLTWITPELSQGKQLNVDQVVASDDVKYSGVDGDNAFTLVITPVPCTDTMSGESFEFTSVWTYAGQRHSGCAKGGN